MPLIHPKYFLSLIMSAEEYPPCLLEYNYPSLQQGVMKLHVCRSTKKMPEIYDINENQITDELSASHKRLLQACTTLSAL